jgi:ABC-type antimicrobial peptide transport system ATPase subunit
MKKRPDRVCRLARMLLRLIKPTSGDVIFDGTNLSGLTGSRCAKCRHKQFFFQNPHSALRCLGVVAVGELGGVTSSYNLKCWTSLLA